MHAHGDQECAGGVAGVVDADVADVCVGEQVLPVVAGMDGVPSGRLNTRPWSSHRSPATMRSISCTSRCFCRSGTSSGGSGIVRVLSAFRRTRPWRLLSSPIRTNQEAGSAEWTFRGLGIARGNVSDPFAIQNQDGRFELFAIAQGGGIRHRFGQLIQSGHLADRRVAGQWQRANRGPR